MASDVRGESSTTIRPAERKCEFFNDQDVFAPLRAAANIPEDFVNSGWDFESFAAGGGKGGTLMAYVGGAYIVKELSPGDHCTLLEISSSYGDHLRGGSSMLSPVFLHFRDINTDRKFFVMKNCVGPGQFIALYDLKGCADDKTLICEGEKIPAVHKRVWNVGMWCGKCNWTPERHKYYNGKVAAAHVSIALTADQRASVLQSVRRDTEWLSANRLMDYSLLVAVKTLDPSCSRNLDGPRHTFLRYSQDGSSTAVFVSIIDFLQKWTFGKKVARGLKFAECNKATVPPRAYGSRFYRTFEGHFQATPDISDAPPVSLTGLNPEKVEIHFAGDLAEEQALQADKADRRGDVSSKALGAASVEQEAAPTPTMIDDVAETSTTDLKNVSTTVEVEGSSELTDRTIVSL